MVTAFVLINVEDRQLTDITQRLKGFQGVAEVHVVAGEYDMVAIVRVDDNAVLANLLTNEIIHTPGIKRTKTLISLQQ